MSQAKTIYLSFAQERLWFIEQYEGGSGVYNMPIVLPLQAATKPEILLRAIEQTVCRHEVLRTLIKTDSEGRGIQCVKRLSEQPLASDYLMMSQEACKTFIQREVEHIFQLDKEYPLRVFILKEHETGKHWLSLVIHHIAFDGWSSNIFFDDVHAYYRSEEAKLSGVMLAPDLPELSIQYKDFAVWQRNYFTEERLSKQMQYWKGVLEGYTPLSFPTDKRRSSQIDYAGSNVIFAIKESVSEGLRRLAKQLKVSLFSVLLSGYYLLLRSYSRQDDLIIGTPMANRHHVQLEHLIGCFVNSLPLRSHIQADFCLIDYILSVSKGVMDAQLYQDLPFEKLVKALNVPIDTSRHPLFQVLFDMKGRSFSATNNQALFELYTEVVSPSTAKFDLTVTIDDSQPQLTGLFNYATNLFTVSTIEGLSETYQYILEQFLRLFYESQLKVKDLRYLSERDYQKVVNDWNANWVTYPKEETIVSLFEHQVNQHPEKEALVYEGISLTYEELNERANQLAHYLRREYEIKPDDLVALYLDRSMHMLIGLLGVLKAGGAYVPLDPAYPAERVRYIVEDTNARVILTQHSQINNLQEITSREKLVIDENVFMAEESSNLTLCAAPTHLAYVIYTSGTTGRPKGVMIENRGIVNRLQWMQKHYLLKPTDKILQKTPYVFDVSVWEFFWGLCYGASIVLAKPSGHQDPSYLINLIEETRISIVHFVPSMLNSFHQSLAGCKENINLSSLRYIFCSGEALALKDVKLLHQFLPFVCIHNLYGPTEASIDVLYSDNVEKIYTQQLGFRCGASEAGEELYTEYMTEADAARNKTENSRAKSIEGMIPIGHPIANTSAYVLDASFAPLPIGAVGELYIGGAGLARGYLNQPALTQEKFVANPFQTDEERALGENARLYRTGDLVKYLPNGELLYFGRMDEQVKLRGYRIELDEIASRLREYPGIDEAVIVVKMREVQAYLVGYYVARTPLDETQILMFLSQFLPDYMIPKMLIHLVALPLTINGKVDKKALPERSIILSDELYVEPRDELEANVQAIYAEVLGLSLDRISIRSDFFRLGGDSIVSMQLVSRLRQRLEMAVTIPMIFEYRSIERLCGAWRTEQVKSAPSIFDEQGVLLGEVRLSPIQRWFFDQVIGGYYAKSDYWNHSFLVKVPPLDEKFLTESLYYLLRQHDAFRLRYSLEEGDVRQSYEGEITQEILLAHFHVLNRELCTDEDAYQSFLTRWQANFDMLGANFLWSIGYIHGFKDGSCRLYFSCHHLIIDTVSWQILISDLKALYEGLKAGKSPDAILGPKGSSYRQWTEALHVCQTNYPAEWDYWQERKALPSYDWHKWLEAKEERASYRVHVDAVLTEQLVRESGSAYSTDVQDMLLTALGLAFYELTGEATQAFTLETHGREALPEHNLSLENTMGWFTSFYPVVFTLTENFAQSLIEVKECLRKLSGQLLGYGLLEGFNNKLPEIVFNYLGHVSGKVVDWSITGEASGVSVAPENKEPWLMSINGGILEGELYIELAGLFQEKALSFLGKLFKEKLIALIEYTVQQPHRYLTASDVNSIVSKDYLARLQTNRAIEGIYLANSLQQGLVYHGLTQGTEDCAYRVQLVYHYRATVNLDNLSEAWNFVLKRYPALRTCFAWEEAIVQIIEAEGIVDWTEKDLSQLSDDLQEVQLAEEIRLDRARVYDLSACPLWRVTVYKRNECHYTILLSYHHAILDGWSLPILLQSVHEAYEQLREGYSEEVLQRKIGYDDAYKQSQDHRQRVDVEAKTYWEKKLADVSFSLDLSGLYKKNQRITSLSEYRWVKEPTVYQHTLSDSEYESLKTYGQMMGVTSHVLVQYVWHKVLSGYSHAQTTVVGTTVSGRELAIDGIEHSVGLYINTLPLVMHHKGSSSIQEELVTLQTSIQQLNQWSGVSLSGLQKGGQRLFDSVLVFENYPIGLTSGVQLVAELEKSIESVDYPLMLVVYEREGGMHFQLSYAGELFDANCMDEFFGVYRHFLRELIRGDKKEASALSYLSYEKYHKIIAQSKGVVKTIPSNETLVSLFERQVKLHGERIAVVYEDKALTYQALHLCSNQIARYIQRKYKVGVEDLVGVYLERGLQVLPALLGILKAGGAYVPLDPSYPKERLAYILEETAPRVILTESGYGEALSSEYSCVFLEQAAWSNESTENLPLLVQSHHLAYVIYTSGTTGKPKGVMIEHRGIVNRLQWMQDNYGVSMTDKILQKTPLVFDVSLWELFWGISYGASVVFARPDGHKEPDYLIELISTVGITILHFVPSLLTVFTRVLLASGQGLRQLRHVFCSGEALTFEAVSDLHQCLPEIQIHNLYGPTEASVDVLHADDVQHSTGMIPLGRPIANTSVYVLNEFHQVLPIGAVGELYLGGVGLARGYLNQLTLTQEKFITNPFQIEKERILGENARLYRTGDLVKFLPNGELLYLGRQDEQVKLRGYRIELGEIVSRLREYPGIDEAVVVLKGQEEQAYLAAYYVGSRELDEALILVFLRQFLPDYMIPQGLVYLTALPLTINGKVDKTALPEVKKTVKNYDPPATATETKLTAIWAEVLGIEMILNTSLSFFDLGGNSLLAMILLGKINTTFEVNFALRDIFEQFTIRSVATKIDKSTPIVWQPLVSVNAQRIDKLNLYIIPGIIGCCAAYYPLASLLSKNYSVKIFEAKGLDGEEKPYINWQAMIEDYFLAIKNDAHSQKIILVAHSAGGQWAVELAYQLSVINFSVQIILIDSAKIGEKKEDPFSSEEKENLLLSAIMEHFNLSHLKKPSIKENISVQQKIGNLLFADNSVDNHYKLKIAQGFINVFKNQIDMALSHVLSNMLQLEKLKTVYIASETNTESEEFINSYRKVFGSVFEDVSSGGHLTMLDNNHVRTLAEKIHFWINQLFLLEKN